FTATEDAPDFASVALSYNGQTQVENVSPYALFSDNARGNFFGDAGFEEGAYTVDVTLYTDRDGRGDVVETFTYEFEFA
ncbi:MAG: hypothetical protein AAFQ88_10080, partial [Pseudomonadota bacterium]